jgi:hypothetical protein
MAADILYGTASGCTGLQTVMVSDSHSASTSTAQIMCTSFSGTLGDFISVDIGYTTDHGVVFTGYVKQIDRQVPNNTYTIIAMGTLIRAVDYFVAPSNPDEPFKRDHILAENLVRDVLELCGLTLDHHTDTSFTFAINSVAEVKLVSCYDYCRMIGDVLTWSLWSDDDGETHFENRKPFPMTGTSGQPGDTADSSSFAITTGNVLNVAYKIDERNLRNRVVVYGAENIHAEASASSPYLPAGYYKTAAVASQIIDTQEMAQKSCDYNLYYYNRLGYSVNFTVLGDHRFKPRVCCTLTESHIGITAEMWYVMAVEHNWGASGYTCNLELRK